MIFAGLILGLSAFNSLSMGIVTEFARDSTYAASNVVSILGDSVSEIVRNRLGSDASDNSARVYSGTKWDGEDNTG